MSPPFPGPLTLSCVVLGGYRIVGVIARGGQAMVYAAQDPHGKPLVVKVPRTDSPDPHANERLAREARLLAQLDHPHIVRYVDGGRDRQSGLYCLVEARVAGVSLDHVVNRRESLSPRDLTVLVGQIASALDAVHGCGHVIRDLTPAQIVAQQRGQGINGTLVDLGLARRTAVASDLTDPAAVAGTPGFVAPEMLEGAAPTPAADVYSLGALAYALLTGRTPFDGLSPEACLAAQFAGHIPSSGQGEPFDSLCAEALSPDPGERPESPFAFASRLAGCLDFPTSLWQNPL